MNKYLLGLIAMLALVIAPNFVLATSSDIDPQGDSSCVSISNNLRYRASDANTNGDVSVLQDFLQTNGYLQSNPVGFFGLMTIAAVKKFQKANDISPTGYVGPITREKIKTESCYNQTSISGGITTIQGQPTTVLSTSSATSSQTVPNQIVTTLTRNLDIGSTGADVTSLQIFLYARGWLVMSNGAVYGVFDQTTKNALSSYQKATGIYPSDGFFGPATRASVNASMATITTLTSPSNTTTNQQIQVSNTTTNGVTSISTVSGCLTGSLFSITTGQSCLNTSPTTTNSTPTPTTVVSQPASNNFLMPVITSVTSKANPSGQFYPGDMIIISGSGFNPNIDATVWIGGDRINVIKGTFGYTNNSISLYTTNTIPAGTYDLYVTNGYISNRVSVTVLYKPTPQTPTVAPYDNSPVIVSINPSDLKAGTSVVVTGRNFVSDTILSIDGWWPGTIRPTFISSTSLSFTIPANIKTGHYNLSVFQNAGLGGNLIPITITN